jgi:uncharacterized BrkB/YihY/UPF0761 family membrane protein
MPQTEAVIIHIPKLGTLPRVEVADQARSLFDRVRANPGMTVAIVAGALLAIAWIAWAIYVTSENGSRAGLGVLVAVPALLAVLALVAGIFFGGYRLIRWLNGDSESQEEPPGDPENAGEAEKAAS